MRQLLFCLFILSAGLLPAQVMGPRQQQVRPDRQEITVTGTLQRTSAGLTLQTAKGPIAVHLGALQHDARTARIIESGADIEVTGAMVNHRGSPVLLARTVVIGGKTFRVRSNSGIAIPRGEVK